jgi:indolepyruvate ferredoxin oxidoreductase
MTVAPTAALAAATLDDRFTRTHGRVLLTGTQALVRLTLLQRARDQAAGLATAGYVTGYRGSPLGGLDQQFERERPRLEAAGVRFQPGVNEDLAATAVWGTQQVGLLPGARVAGVFALWYGKGPGVDRSGDPIKHGNRQGTSPHGGVLVVFGDDHGGKSSTISHHSEPALAANGVPVLYPASVQEYVDFGLHGIALSRFAGTWVGFKCVNETVESTGTVEVDPERIRPVLPDDVPDAPDGVHARFAFDPLGDDVRLVRHKLPRAQAYVRANRLDRVTHGAARPAGPGSLGIVAAGKSWLDVVGALRSLGLDASRLAALGVAVYKPALIWPLEPQGLVEFARARAELLVVEEKAAFLEPQIATILYNLADERPRLSGKRDPDGRPLLAADVLLEPLELARTIGGRLRALGRADEALERRLELLECSVAAARARAPGPTARIPYFCAGCPHNTSTKVPDGSLALGGIGCHTMAIHMNRRTMPPTHMGGEGMNWAGAAPFTDLPHVFQNIGDGTYFHSGLLAIRAAVASGVNITYKLLYNDAVAMTGGQAVEGQLSVAEITHQLRGERVGRIAVVSDDPGKYGRQPGFAAGTTLHDRTELEAVQRELRAVKGVTAIVYEQTCATEKRRRRKRGRLAVPARRVLINADVCEGCGDCSVQSNCVAVEPVETPLGRKRAIDQSSCNQDYSCVRGFCPSFVTVEGGRLRRPAARSLDPAALLGLPEPRPADTAACGAVLVTGIGGTGVVTIGAVLAMAAHVDGIATRVFDVTGLAQKGGGVTSHLKFAAAEADLGSPRVAMLEADLVLGCDLVMTASAEPLRTIEPGRTRVVLNTHVVPTAAFQLNPDLDFRARDLAAAVAAALGAAPDAVDATGAARALLGDSLGSNMLVVGYALQKGWLPVSLAAVRRAIELNGTAVEMNLRALDLGRLAAHAPEEFARRVDAAGGVPAARAASGGDDLAALVARHSAALAEYQDEAYAARYRALVARVAEVESARAPGSTRLAAAVARYYAKLLAYKDEYEVARLHSTTLAPQLEATFEGEYRVTFHLAPPLLARRDPVSGVPAKRAFGPWILPVLRLLARARRLRGTPLDPFGWTAERRMERELIAEYERRIEVLLAGLTPQRVPLAVEIASLPEQVRGFGHVKARHVAAVRERERELLARWDTADGRPAQGAARAA